MGDDLVGLHAKAKVIGSFGDPFLDRGFLQQLPEAEVYFHGIQLGCVVVEEVFLRELLGIEVRLPGWIGPSRGAGEELRHYGCAVPAGLGSCLWLPRTFLFPP